MRIIFCKTHCFHLHRLSYCYSILHISVSISHQTSILRLWKSTLGILKIWHISQHQVVPQWFFFSKDKDGNGNSFINNRYVCMEVRKWISNNIGQEYSFFLQCELFELFWNIVRLLSLYSDISWEVLHHTFSHTTTVPSPIKRLWQR